MSTATTVSATDTLYSLWLSVEPLCRLWARQYLATSETRLFDLDDLMQSAFLAVYDTAQQHDPERGAFTTLLRFRIRSRFNEVAGIRTSKRDAANYATSLDVPLADDYEITRADITPFNTISPERHRELSALGGKASGESKRRKKAERQAMIEEAERFALMEDMTIDVEVFRAWQSMYGDVKR